VLAAVFSLLQNAADMSSLAQTAGATDARHFLARRLHSLVGIVPLGAFVVFHFWFHSYSHAGSAVYDAKLAELYAWPLKTVLAWITVYLPLIYHSIYGLFITREAGPNFLAYGWFRNWMYTLQRASGIGLLLFIPAHLVKARWPHVFFPGETMSYAHEVHGFASPLTTAIYAAGILGTAFHLANGVFTFGITWGWWIGPRAQRLASYFSVASFLVLAAMGMWAMIGFFG
jgi:succinate dehydrogenase / fumarate reductase cytochrome b subunit